MNEMISAMVENVTIIIIFISHERGAVSDASSSVGAGVRRADVLVALEDVPAPPHAASAQICGFPSHARHEWNDDRL